MRHAPTCRKTHINSATVCNFGRRVFSLGPLQACAEEVFGVAVVRFSATFYRVVVAGWLSPVLEVGGYRTGSFGEMRLQIITVWEGGSSAVSHPKLQRHSAFIPVTRFSRTRPRMPSRVPDGNSAVFAL